MRQHSLRGWVAAAGMAAGVLGWSLAAQGQMPEDGGPGEFGVAGGQMVRGTVTAVAPDKITVKTESGEVYQVELSANSRLMKARQPVKTTEIKAGDGVGAMGVLDAATKTVHAVFVTVIDAEEVKKAREGMGKIFIAGKVTAMDDLKLTVLRTDGVSQVIEVDEGTSFKKGGRGLQALVYGGIGGGMGGGGGRQGGADGAGSGVGRADTGESITLADIKVGDTVAGRGAVKNGVFVPTELGVVNVAAAGGKRRRRPNGEAGGAGPASTAAGASAGAARPAGSAPAPQ